VRWVITRGSFLKATSIDRLLKAGQRQTAEATLSVPNDMPVTQPYWLREDGTPGMFRVDDPNLIGRPENPPAFPIDYVFEVGGKTLVLHDEPVFREQNSGGERLRPIDVVAPVSLRFGSAVSLFR